MSNQVPLLRFGQRVRIMQTTEMEELGLANRHGTVMERQRTPSHRVRVALDEADTEYEEHIEVSAASLMRE